jgi:carboxylate-amine ligase
MVVAQMLDHEVILDEAMLYWDVRLSAHLPTLEIRVGDVPATVDETVLLATLVRGLVVTALRAIHHGHRPPAVDPHQLRAAYWRAARDGITGRGIDVASGNLVPSTEPILRVVDHIRPALDLLGDYADAQAALTRILEAGNGAVRQRQTLQTGTLDDVLEILARSTTDTVTPE